MITTGEEVQNLELTDGQEVIGTMKFMLMKHGIITRNNYTSIIQLNPYCGTDILQDIPKQ